MNNFSKDTDESEIVKKDNCIKHENYTERVPKLMTNDINTQVEITPLQVQVHILIFDK